MENILCGSLPRWLSHHFIAEQVPSMLQATPAQYASKKASAAPQFVVLQNPQAFKLVLNYGLHFECRPEALRDRTSLQFGLQGDAEPPFIPECALVSA